jgi:DNA-binding NtrC family response regulator
VIPAVTTDSAPEVLLLVEDDDALRTTWAGLLAQEGLEVRSAVDAGSALREAAQSPRPTLALLDLGLPPEPGDPRVGLALLQQLLLEIPRLKVVVLTGQGEPSVCWEAIGHGAFDYLLKPASRASVLQSLQRARLFVESERRLALKGQARLTVTAPLGEGVREFGEAAQERLVRTVLEDCGHNVAQASRALGLSRENLYYFIRKFGIDR